MKLKAFSKKKEEKKAEINPQQKLVNRKPVLKHITLRYILVFAPWHSFLEPYYTHSVENALHTHAVKSPYLQRTGLGRQKIHNFAVLSQIQQKEKGNLFLHFRLCPPSTHRAICIYRHPQMHKIILYIWKTVSDLFRIIQKQVCAVNLQTIPVTEHQTQRTLQTMHRRLRIRTPVLSFLSFTKATVLILNGFHFFCAFTSYFLL